VNLYQLTGAVKLLHEMVDEDNADELAELEAKLLDELIPEKVDDYRRLLMTLASECRQIDAEVERLRERSSVRSRLADRLKARLKQALELAGLAKIKSSLGEVAIQKSPPTVAVDDLECIPRQFFDDVEPRLAKSRISAALRSGDSVPGARLVYSTHLRIR